MKTSGFKLAGVVLAAAVASSVALPAAAASTASMTKAKARTVAKHINLHQTDFPGYKMHPYQSSKGARTTEQNYQECVGLASQFAEKHSDSFSTGHDAIYSSVTEFVSSRAVAQADDVKAASQRARDCFKQELTGIAKAVGSSSTTVTITPVTESPVSGLDAIYGLKFKATYTVLGYHGTLYGWQVGFSRGNAEVTLSEIGTADVPSAKIDAAVNALVNRAVSKVPANGRPVG